ncbi:MULTISPECIES: DUF2905 domain-containing protein [Bacillaceae]|jgi:hypothetical protein|uniref:DUF2905 domain-containing protein n=1 Tax=Gottfriedia luciferensis TaxID=178774 RepID=A0ABX2ZKQ3_9BACI|nr:MULTISPECIES: DUF2905 domain-containing protein [Bacillaceae]KQL38092.1 hypothetical protein AN960_14125 [Bacillus sp. FJAT-25509]ODG90286.1 hypothetical protein BED47_13235 [Gottfriedia luciferensis]PEC47496.1 DUF2905 domain-containing protein [Bacillus sp. AFS096315]PFH90215.1 DUF2905 domain-containing protein [Bacillus sp. AFS088145]PFM76090.1 DUF2905 domain-containing protein [Bacillus sp. AFS077874]
MIDLSKILITLGIILLVVGLFIRFVGKLPGDIFIKKGNVSFYFPIVTCIIISILLSLIFSLFGRK